MSVAPAALEKATLGLHPLEQYETLIGAAAVERIARKADHARDLSVVHVSSTFYGGGVTEILTPLTLMMNTLGIQTGWHLIQGTPAFFNSLDCCNNHSVPTFSTSRSVLQLVISLLSAAGRSM